MRDIKIIINDDGYASSYEKFIGIQNENEATRLVFDLPDIYKKDGSYQYVAFTLPDGTIKVRSLVDYACIIDSEITSQRGVILISVIIKSVENVLDIETGFIMSSQPISGYIKKTILEETGTNSIDKNVRIYLDEFDALLMEIRKADERFAKITESTSSMAEVIDAREDYTSLRLRLLGDKEYLINELNIAVNNAKNNLNASIDNEKNTRANNDENLQRQINSLVVGAGSETESYAEIVQARINISSQLFTTLNDRISFIEHSIPFQWKVLTNIDLNTILKPSKSILITPSANSPFGNQTAFLKVEVYPNQNSIDTESYPWIVQTIYSLKTSDTKTGFATRIIQRLNKGTYIYGDWCTFVREDFEEIKNTLNGNIARKHLSDSFSSNGHISTNIDFNTLLKQGNYIVSVGNGANNPLKSSGILTVQVNDLGAYSNKWVTQTYQDIVTNKIMTRSIRYDNVNPDKSMYYEWRQLYPIVQDTVMKNKKVVNFGDSIFGNFNDSTSISNQMSNILGTSCINVGFGGCQMSDRPDPTAWAPFSMCNLATAIATGDFTAQDNAINNPNWKDKPSYFANHLQLIKDMDFSTVDYITIAYGTNDYTAGDILDNPNDKLDKNTVMGALRYSIETILTAYPNIRILIGTPIFRLWLESDKSTIKSTSNEVTYAGGYTLKEMVEKYKEVGKEYQIPVLDAYNNLSLNKFNWRLFFDNTDTTHPNAKGRYLVAKSYASKLIDM